MDNFDQTLRDIIEIGGSLHTVGTFSARTLKAIARITRGRQILNSAETGSGASTLLFSHLSPRHTVFAKDAGSGSVVNTRRSSLLRRDVVTFVEGPTQTTLPRHVFTEKLQLVLIDGPHGYPFPELEYYFLYPHIAAGGLLILDDIHIPTVHHLFAFLRRDAMFHLEEIVGVTAFFTRTDAPVFDPLGDGWWLQSYNKRPFRRYLWKEKIRELLRLGDVADDRRLAEQRESVTIESPREGATVSDRGAAEGNAELSPGLHLWILARRCDAKGWWPQGGGPASLQGDRWHAAVEYGGGAASVGFDFEIAAVVVGRATHEFWLDWAARVRETGESAPVQLPPAGFIKARASIKVRKNS